MPGTEEPRGQRAPTEQIAAQSSEQTASLQASPTASITQLPRPSRVPEAKLHLETQILLRAVLRRNVRLICFDMCRPSA